MPFSVPVRQDQDGCASLAGGKELRMDGVVLRPGRPHGTGKGQNVIGIELVISRRRRRVPCLAALDRPARKGAEEFSGIRMLRWSADVFQPPREGAHEAVVIRLPTTLLVSEDVTLEPVT